MSNNLPPESNLLASIRQKMDARDTEELLDIYTDHDTESWIPATFDIIKGILLERGFDSSELISLTRERAEELARTNKAAEEKTQETWNQREDSVEEDDDLEIVDTPLARSIRQAMNNKDIDELLDLFSNFDSTAWVPGTFGIIKEILIDRGVIEGDEEAIALMNESSSADSKPGEPGAYLKKKRYFAHPVTQEDRMKADICKVMNEKGTENLLNLFALNDSETWSETTFEVVRDILIDRGWPEDEVDNLILETPSEDDIEFEEDEE